jgi:hypothetical protein
MGIANLAPEHLQKLRASGLTDATIVVAGLHSARPGDMPRLLGRPVPDGVSGLVLPYPGDDGFCRVRLFPPIPGGNGRTIKYLQPPRTGCRLYIPPAAAAVLGDPTKPLAWTEGELKALAACQAGVPSVGLGGLWNWTEDGHPIDGLDGIAHVDREEIIYPDSDVWTRPDLLRAVYAFGRELERRGAKITVAVIPPGGLDKVGLDDLLATRGADALHGLNRVGLKHNVFAGAVTWFKGWEKRRHFAPAPDADDLIKRLTPKDTIRAAQDFVRDTLSYGIVVDGHVLLVTSKERKLIRPDELPPDMRLANSGFNLCRFSKDGILNYLRGRTEDGPRLVLDLVDFFSRFARYPDPETPLLLAVWTLGTYTYRIFRLFPYLSLRSPEKRCGKSRVLDLLALVAFNAEGPTTNPTAPTLFRGPSGNGGTLLLDELEGLRGDKERWGDVITVLNEGFEAGRTVIRLEKQGERFVERHFEVYCPRAFASIKPLTDTVEDRSLTIFMARRKKTERIERFNPRRLTALVQGLRDRCYTWALTRAEDVAEVYEKLPEIPALADLDDRARDCCEPLLAISYLVDAETQQAVTARDAALLGPAPTWDPIAPRLIGLALRLANARAATAAEGDAAALVGALGEIRQAEGRDEFTPSELLALLQARSGFEWVKNTKALAGLMHPLGFVSRSHKRAGKPIRAYLLEQDRLDDLRARYAVDGSSGTVP